MASERKVTVKPTGGGGDYTSLASAVSGEADDLVTDDVYLVIEISGDWTSDGEEVGSISVSGYTTDSTRFITIKAIGDARHDGKRYASKASSHRLRRSTTETYQGTVYCNEPYTVFEGLQFSITQNNSYSYVMQMAASYCVIRQCILTSANRTNSAMRDVHYVDNGFYFHNNLLHDINSGFGANGETIYKNSYNDGGRYYIYNNTCDSCADGFRMVCGNNDQAYVYNNLITNIGSGNNTHSYAAGSGVSDFGYNAVDTAEDDGSNNQTNITDTDQYVSLTGGSEDYHLKAGSDCLEVGDELGSTYDRDVDIDGDTRPASWDISCHQYSTGAVNSTQTPSASALTLTLQTPTVVITQASPEGAMTLTLETPTVSITEDITVSPSAQALTLTLESPTVSAEVNNTQTPSEQALTLTLESPTISADNTQAPSEQSLTLTLETPTVVIGNSVAPATQTLTLTLETPTVSIVSNPTVTPNTLALTSALLAPSPYVSDDVTPGNLDLTLTLESPSIVIDDTETPATLSLALTLESPTVAIDEAQTPATQTLTLTLETPTVVIDSTVTPDTLELTATVESPAIQTGSSSTFVATNQDLTLTLLAPTVVLDSTQTPDTLELTASVLAPTPEVDIFPSEQVLTSSLETPDILSGAVISPDEQTLTVSVLAPTILIDSSETDAGNINMTVSVLAPVVIIDATPTPDTLELTATVLAPSFTFGKTVTPSPLGLTASVLSPALETRVAPPSVDLTAGLLATTYSIDAIVAIQAALALTLNIEDVTLGASKFHTNLGGPSVGRHVKSNIGADLAQNINISIS